MWVIFILILLDFYFFLVSIVSHFPKYVAHLKVLFSKTSVGLFWMCLLMLKPFLEMHGALSKRLFGCYCG